jgi:8-oxo-dGTP pyrophosphatase MutT (NUDIX family)
MAKMTQEQWQKSVEWVGIVAGCVIKQDGKYLLVQEKQAKVYGLWNLPAGYVDKGETVEQAAVREVQEESGLQVKLGRKIGIYHEGVGRPVKHIFGADITGGELHVQEDEILAAKWLDVSEVKDLAAQGKLRAPWILEAITETEEE